MSKYLMRFDDINSRIDWDRFFKIKEKLEKYQIKSILGVVPTCLDENLFSSKPLDKYYDYLRKCKAYGDKIAQHGFTHKYDSRKRGFFGRSKCSEFAGHNIQEQLRRLQKGKSILKDEGLWEPIFMAPSHSFDLNTLLALKKTGFETVLDGISLFPYRNYSLNFIPQISSKPLPAFLPGISQLCIHINTISDNDLRNLIDFVERNNNKFITIDQINANKNLLNIIDRLIIYILFKIYRVIFRIKIILKNFYFKIRCLIQRIYYRFIFRNHDIYKWHINGTFFCREYKIKIVKIINHLNPKIYIDIGCGLGEILSKVKIEPYRKIGYDLDLNLKNLIPILYKNDFKFFSNENSLYNYAKKLDFYKEDIIVISMLNFIHDISENSLIELIEKCHKNLGKYILIIDNIFVKSEIYRFNHHHFLINHYGLIKYWSRFDSLRSLYCIQIG